MATGGELNYYKCDQERTNYARLSRAIIDLCSQVLRDVLGRHILPKDIYDKVNKCTDLDLNPLLHGIMSSASIMNSYEKYDITLLYAVIRFLCPSIKPTAGWGLPHLPSPSNTAEGDDVERIRVIRNNIFAHVSNTRINDSVFRKNWQVLRDVMIRMDRRFGPQSSYNQKLTVIENVNMDAKNERKVIEIIKKMAGKEKEIWRAIQQITQKIDELHKKQQSMEKKMTDMDSELNKQKQHFGNFASETAGEKSVRIKSAIEKSTLDEINRHKESKIFVPTKAFIDGKSKLDEHGVLIYTGLPGDGKSETSIAIMESYQQEHPDWCYIMYSDIHHWPKVHTDIDSVILYDDCLGRTNTNTGVINEGNDIWPRILSSVKAGKIKVIFTVRKNIISTNQIELEKYELFHKNHVIDLTTDEYKLTQDDKIQIFKSHCQRKNIGICKDWRKENYRQENELKKGIPIRISTETMIRIVNTDPVIGFPFSCYLYTCHVKYIVQGVSFFQKPIRVLHNEISRLMKIESKAIEKLQYCIMVYMVLKQGHINLDEIDEDILRQVFKSVGEECLSQRYIKEAVQELNHKYLVGYYPMFSFKHQTLLESVSICFWEDNAPLVLRYCSKGFITEFIRPKDYKEAEGEVVVKLKERDYKHLIERFIDFVDSSVDNFCSHPVMQDKDFVDLFIDVLKSDKTRLSPKSSSISELINSASSSGNMHLLNRLSSINVQIQDTLTTLFYDKCYFFAGERGHTDIVVWLLDHGIKLDRASMAIQYTKDSTLLPTIINHPNIKLDHFKEALRFRGDSFQLFTCTKFNSSIIKLVFSKWQDIDLESVSILFISCCYFDEIKSIELIINGRPGLITPQAVNEGFRYACLCGNLKVVHLLVNCYPDLINTQEILNEGFSLSCAMGKTEILDFLIEITNSKSDATSKQQLNKGFIFATPFSKQFYDLPYELKQNEEELTNLHIAAFFGMYAVVKKLIGLGLDITSKTRSGVSVLQFAMAGIIEFIPFSMNLDTKHILFINNKEKKFLSNYFAYCIHFQREKMYHIFDERLIESSEELLIYLIKHEDFILSDLDITIDSSGNTIAHYCVVYDYLSVIELLCNVHRSVMFVHNKNNHRPIDLAVLMGRDEVFKLLYSNDTRFNSNTTQTQQEYDELHTLFSIGIKYTDCSFDHDYPDFVKFLSPRRIFIDFGKRKNYKEIEKIINGQLQENAHAIVDKQT